MRFNVTLDRLYFDFAKADRFTFDGWLDDGTSTFEIDLPEQQNTTAVDYFGLFILPAIHNFHRRCANANFNPTPDTQIGYVLYPDGAKFPIISAVRNTL